MKIATAAPFFSFTRVLRARIVLAGVGVTLILTNLVIGIWPAAALAATGQVSVTDTITFSGNAPTQDPLVLTSSTMDKSGNYPMAVITATNPQISGNIAIFKASFTAVYDYPSSGSSTKPTKTYQPIPAGKYSLASFDTGQTITVNVTQGGSGAASLAGTYSPVSFSNLPSNVGTSVQKYVNQVCGESGSTSNQLCTSGSAYCQSNAKASTCTQGSNTPTAATCESTGFSLSWILCPIINGISGAERAIIHNILDPLLTIPPVSLNHTTSDPTHTYAIWSNFRVYGDVFLVIAILVVVFAESIGGGLIEAYTAKKMLPRVLIAAILINLSIYLVAALVDVFNVLGKGIEAIITSPFASANGGVLQIHLSGGVSGGALVAVFGAGALWAAGGFAGIGFLALTVLLPLVLATIGVIVTLLIRYALILFLIFVSPVAFALYVLQYFRIFEDL